MFEKLGKTLTMENDEKRKCDQKVPDQLGLDRELFENKVKRVKICETETKRIDLCKMANTGVNYQKEGEEALAKALSDFQILSCSPLKQVQKIDSTTYDQPELNDEEKLETQQNEMNLMMFTVNADRDSDNFKNKDQGVSLEDEEFSLI